LALGKLTESKRWVGGGRKLAERDAPGGVGTEYSRGSWLHKEKARVVSETSEGGIFWRSMLDEAIRELDDQTRGGGGRALDVLVFPRGENCPCNVVD